MLVLKIYVFFAGLVTGFFCCSTGAPSGNLSQEAADFEAAIGRPQARYHKKRHAGATSTHSSGSSIVICAPSSPIQPQPALAGASHVRNNGDWLMTSRTTCSASEASFWEDTKQAMTSSPVHRPRATDRGWNSPPPHLTSTSSSATSSTGSSGIQQQPQRSRPPQICRFCQSTNPGEDCRDGFCSSIWNKENLMRPIHI